MSVTDVSAPAVKVKPDWKALRYEYETTTISQRDLAEKHNLSRSTLMQRAMREKWLGTRKLVKLSANRLEAELNTKVDKIVRDELAPFIERHKTLITKRGVRLANNGLGRIEKLWKGAVPKEPKNEADTARAVETLVRVARTSLGMNDGNVTPGALTLNVLTNQAALQINSGTALDQSA